MMRTFIAVLFLLLLAACKRDPEVPAPPAGGGGASQGAVKFTVVPLWNGGPFDKTVTYANANGHRVIVQLAKFYLSPVELMSGTDHQQLFGVDLFNVTNGATQRILPVPPGRYDGLHFGLGLPASLNHLDITTIDPNAPMGNNSGMYWTWATMYRFCLFEGRYDTLLGATGPLPYAFAYHTGLDTLYRERTLPVDLEVVEDDTVELVVTVDLARFFTNGMDTVDLSQGSSFHGEPTNLPLGIRLADLQRDAFDVQ